MKITNYKLQITNYKLLVICFLLILSSCSKDDKYHSLPAAQNPSVSNGISTTLLESWNQIRLNKIEKTNAVISHFGNPNFQKTQTYFQTDHEISFVPLQKPNSSQVNNLLIFVKKANQNYKHLVLDPEDERSLLIIKLFHANSPAIGKIFERLVLLGFNNENLEFRGDPCNRYFLGHVLNQTITFITIVWDGFSEDITVTNYYDVVPVYDIDCTSTPNGSDTGGGGGPINNSGQNNLNTLGGCIAEIKKIHGDNIFNELDESTIGQFFTSCGKCQKLLANPAILKQWSNSNNPKEKCYICNNNTAFGMDIYSVLKNDVRLVCTDQNMDDILNQVLPNCGETKTTKQIIDHLKSLGLSYYNTQSWGQFKDLKSSNFNRINPEDYNLDEEELCKKLKIAECLDEYAEINPNDAAVLFFLFQEEKFYHSDCDSDPISYDDILASLCESGDFSLEAFEEALFQHPEGRLNWNTASDQEKFNKIRYHLIHTAIQNKCGGSNGSFCLNEIFDNFPTIWNMQNYFSACTPQGYDIYIDYQGGGCKCISGGDFNTRDVGGYCFYDFYKSDPPYNSLPCLSLRVSNNICGTIAHWLNVSDVNCP